MRMQTGGAFLDTGIDEKLGSISRTTDDGSRCATLYRHMGGLHYYHICRREKDGPLEEFLLPTDHADAALFLREKGAAAAPGYALHCAA